MMTPNFETTAHAKCVLIGEHAVVRGSPALVSPVMAKKLSLCYYESDKPLSVEIDSPLESLCKVCFNVVLTEALKLTHHELSALKGTFRLVNNIEIAGGLGFSAAICVAVTKWLIWKNWLAQSKIFYFARQLENLFHNKSSGIDIIGSLANHLTYFKQPLDIHRVYVNWYPRLYLSYSGAMKNTGDAVAKVSRLQTTSPSFAQEIDRQMQASVEQVIVALSINSVQGLEQLANAIHNAYRCFEAWQLITAKLKQHMSFLQLLGCIACKPTGAGGGGFVLSLWKNTPPESELPLMPIFKDL